MFSSYMQRALDAQPANGSGQMTVPIKSDGVSCLSSYRSGEETRHTRDIQHANQERKCDVSEYDKEEDSCCCWRSCSRRQRSRRQRQKQRATNPAPFCCWRGCCRNSHALHPHPLRSPLQAHAMGPTLVISSSNISGGIRIM